MSNLRGIDSDELYSRESIRDELKKHNEEFDLERFYFDNLDDILVNSTGFRIVSPNQMINCYCYPYSSKHEDIIENILFSMFDDYNQVYRSNNYDWRNTCAELGVIAIQLISKYYTLIWMPNRINSFQYNALVDFYKEISDFMNKGLDITISVNFVKDGGGNLPMTLDRAVKYAKNIVDDSKISYGEAIIEGGKTLKRGNLWSEKR